MNGKPFDSQLVAAVTGEKVKICKARSADMAKSLGSLALTDVDESIRFAGNLMRQWGIEPRMPGILQLPEAVSSFKALCLQSPKTEAEAVARVQARSTAPRK